MRESFNCETAVTNHNAELRQALHQLGLNLQRNQVTMKAVQDKSSELEAARAQLYDELSGSISACRVLEKSLRCEKTAHADTKRILDKQWETCKQLNALIATSPTIPTSPTSPTSCRVDLKEKKDMIERLEEVIHDDRKNQEALEQRLREMCEGCSKGMIVSAVLKWNCVAFNNCVALTRGTM